MKLIILGGGIMGCSTAYHARKIYDAKNLEEPLEIIIVERKAIASCASGKAGGFLAKEWCSGALKPLAHISYDMYKEFAEEFGADKIQYRAINSVSAHYVRQKEKANVGAAPQQKSNRDMFGNVFHRKKLVPGQLLGNTDTTAQVTPWYVTNLFFRESGATLVKGELIGVNFHENDSQRIISVVIKNKNDVQEIIEGDEFCFCLGVWTYLLKKMRLKVPNSIGRKIHSVVLKPNPNLLKRVKLLNMAIFTDYNNVEIIIRESGSVYINCSEKGFEKVKLLPEGVQPDEEACNKIIAFWELITDKPENHRARFQDMSSSADVAKNDNETAVLFKQGCHLPLVEHDYKGEQLPVLSAIPKTRNGYICSGHTCWGILLGPISGNIMAELILNNDDSKIVDTTPFRLQV